MKEETVSYLEKRKRAFRYAGNGLRRLVEGEAHARIHAAVAVAVIAAGAVMGLTATEWCLVAICIGAVFAAEAFNTAVEKLADKVNPGYDPLIGAAKDIAAGGVLAMAGTSVIVGLVIFLPKIWNIFINFAD